MTDQPASDPAAVEPPLPDLDEGLLDVAGLDALFRDVAACTELIEVIVKGGAQRHASDAPLSLDMAAAMLRGRQVRGVQLRYRYDGAEWWDTLLALPEGFKVVRIRHDWSAT